MVYLCYLVCVINTHVYSLPSYFYIYVHICSREVRRLVKLRQQAAWVPHSSNRPEVSLFDLPNNSKVQSTLTLHFLTIVVNTPSRGYEQFSNGWPTVNALANDVCGITNVRYFLCRHYILYDELLSSLFRKLRRVSVLRPPYESHYLAYSSFLLFLQILSELASFYVDVLRYRHTWYNNAKSYEQFVVLSN